MVSSIYKDKKRGNLADYIITSTIKDCILLIYISILIFKSPFIKAISRKINAIFYTSI